MKIVVVALLTFFLTGCGGAQMSISPGRAPFPPSGSFGFSDSFPYANGDLTSVSGGNWTNAAALSTELYVSSNIVSSSTSSSCGTYCFVVWTGGGGPAPANQSTQVTFTGISSDFLGPAVLTTTASQTGYAALCTTTYGSAQCELVKMVSGTETTLVAAGATISTTSTVKLTASVSTSTTLTIYVNGASYETYTDSSSPITSGTWGLGDAGTSGDTHISNATGTTP